jgi:predicted nucleic acid-binding protein
MKILRAVVDSSSLIGLAKIGKFELLKELFAEVYIPDAVYKEVVIEGKGEPGSEETEKAIKDGWIIRKYAADIIAVQALSSTLGKGEAEVIILCKELNSAFAVLDERTARAAAELMDIHVIGVIGIIDLAIEKGFDINKKVLVDILIDSGFRISNRLYKSMFPGS